MPNNSHFFKTINRHYKINIYLFFTTLFGAQRPISIDGEINLSP